MEQVLEMIMNKETVFFGLFLYGYYLQQKDKLEQRELINHHAGVIAEQQTFISKQQEVLKDIKDSVFDMAKNQEKITDRLEHIEKKLGE
ncbi:hypothetical protein CON64_18550 [Bacillus pseudomycoides]|nr:hypothetical protein CON64_18550 [Bacillus pseudomycoides]